jgi:hypothetical protein
MSFFLYHDEEEGQQKLNIDDLFEKQQQHDLKQLSIYNKLLNRIHKRIKHVSRSIKKETHMFYNVPEYIFGESIYNNKDCTGYLVANLEKNGFHVRYIHPNTLFISWKHWIPSYVRTEIKKKTGVVLDEKGNVISKSEKVDSLTEDLNNGLFNTQNQDEEEEPKEKKSYNDISDYKPTGKLVYNPEILEKIEQRVSFR